MTYPKDAGMLVTGAANGKLYVWKDEVLTSCVAAHQGPVFAIHALEKVRVLFSFILDYPM